MAMSVRDSCIYFEEDQISEHMIRFPWRRSDSLNPDITSPSVHAKPGEYVLQALFLEYCRVAERKIEQVLDEPLERSLAKSLQRGDDAEFDQLLCSLGTVAEQSLPSLLITFFRWYELQNLPDDGLKADSRHRHKSKGGRDFLCERRDLAVEFVYCQALIEILAKLSYHPGHDDLVGTIIAQAFRHFKYRDGLQTNPNATNINMVADLYAEVIGVLAQSRFIPVRKTFQNELKELKLRDQTPYTAQSIISLLMGLKFFRVKMHPIEDFETCVSFLHELGHYFLEVKDRDIKHSLSGLFVEILLPVASTAKNEVNIPVLKNFVDMLYSNTVDMTTKKKHTQHLFPLVTCLLCVSQKQFFLNNWPYFLTMCLSQLKNKDNKMSRVALESLYRLLWVYMVRIKCESNIATQSRLQSIVNSLFPKGSKMVTPRDTPLNIFVKIIQFIAKERLDFAMKEIVFDLLCVGRPIKLNLTPERMSVGLRAFLVIADSLQVKDGDPPMPQSTLTLPSGSTIRVKRNFVNKMLSDTTAKHIGLSQYHNHILKTFDSILRALDLQVGRPLLLSKAENMHKEPEDMITADRKPKLDLFRTCIAAIPRLIPDGMTGLELVELLSRLTLHVDEELKSHAFQSLQNLILESDQRRDNVIRGYVTHIQREISDTSNPSLLDSALRMLVQLLIQWKSNVHLEKPSQSNKDRGAGDGCPSRHSSARTSPLGVLHAVEGLAVVMLCHSRVVSRKLAVHLLKEVRCIHNSYQNTQTCEPCLIDVLDKACPTVLEKILPQLPTSEKALILTSSCIDFQWVMERASSVWATGFHDNNASEGIGWMPSYSSSHFDMWLQCMTGFISEEFAMSMCPHSVGQAWPIVYSRLNALFPLVDPSTQTSENRASSILRGSKKVTTERDMHIQLWQNYVVLACRIAQQGSVVLPRCASPELSSSPESSGSDKSEARQNGSVSTASNLCHLLVPLMKCENSEMREAIVNGLGYINPAVFKELVDEILPYLKEAIEKKADNIKRRRKRDILRVQLARMFEIMAQNKTFAHSNSVMDRDQHCLNSTFLDYIDGARQYLEGENDRDLPILQDIRLHFSRFIYQLIHNTSIEYRRTLLAREPRYSLFHLFDNWSGRFSVTRGTLDRRLSKEETCTDLELSAVRAMSAVLCCGPVFDQSSLNDDGYVYSWLDKLLRSHDEKIYEIATETVVLLLDYNPDPQALLDWVIDRCYTGANEVADGCFRAMEAVFQSREYPCDHVAMLNLAVLNIGSPRIEVHETALQLLHLLDKRFFQDELYFPDGGEDAVRQRPESLNDILLCVSYSNSQTYLAEQLARIHPELTMPMFSEITHRFQTAKPSVQQILLKCLLPWLHNMELVDPGLPAPNPLTDFLSRVNKVNNGSFKPPLKGEGWGSAQATEMVLNNLFYITVRFGDDHPRDIEALWSSLVLCWTNNLKVIIRYLVIITNMAAAELLPFAKRVVSYLGRAKAEKLTDELMNELQSVETLNVTIERTQTPPYYRLSQMRKVPTAPNTTDDEKLVTHVSDIPLEKGMLHTKRHSTNEDVPSESTPRTNSTTSLQSVSSTSSVNSVSMAGADQSIVVDIEDIVPAQGETRRSESPSPYPLPLPAYGGYFAPLTEFLPETMQASPGYHRSNIAVMFLSDLVLDGLDIDWSPHLPMMLHIIFLGLDHAKELVYTNCKRLLLSLMLWAAIMLPQDQQNIVRMLFQTRCGFGDVLNLVSEEKDRIGMAEAHYLDSAHLEAGKSTFSVDSAATLIPDKDPEFVDPESVSELEKVVKMLLNFMDSRKERPLWSYEDITPKTLVTASATQLEYFLRHVVRIFKELCPLALVEQRCSQMALEQAISCSSRHYAGRSFQVLRALHIRPSTEMLSKILSRLVETVAEQGDDMQGYVTEIMLTLEAAIDNLDLDFRPIDFMKELFKSTPNLANEPSSDARRGIVLSSKLFPQHSRSTSYSLSMVTSRLAALPVDARNRSSSSETEPTKSSLPRSRSAQSLKNLDQSSTEDKLTIMAQMFWIAVSMLESDFEYEFLLSAKLLQKILKHVQPDRPECREKLDKILQQIKWHNFPGVQTLLLKVYLLNKECIGLSGDASAAAIKNNFFLQLLLFRNGCTSQVTAEATWTLLAQITLCIYVPVMDPSGAFGFPMNVMALLPYLVQNYENPTQACRTAADNIAQICGQQSERLSNLATVMSLYSRGTFGKDSFQWTKCVVKYLHDVYACASLTMITFLVDVLEKGPTFSQSAVLQILHCMVHYIDINTPPSDILNAELFNTVVKRVEDAHWKEALKILKLAVTRSSTLAAVPPSATSSISSDLSSLTTHTSFAEAEVFTRKELPGRTLDFSVDLSQSSVIGRKYLSIELPSRTDADGNPLVITRKSSTNQEADSVWRRPHMSQARTRERLVSLMNCYGQRRDLPKSPSVIFSQSSDTLDHQQSVGSSGEEASLPDATASDILLNDSNGNDLRTTFKGFDFLDFELEDSETNEDYFSLTVRSGSLNLDDPSHIEHHHFGSVPDLKFLDTVTDQKVVTPSDSISMKEEQGNSDDNESGADDDGMPQDLPSGGSIIVQNTTLEHQNRSSPISVSTHSLHSMFSEPDVVDLCSSTASPSFTHHAAYLSLQNDEVEDVWKNHVDKVMTQTSLQYAINTGQIFPRLYRELRRRLANLTIEAGYYISKTDSLQNIASSFHHVLDILFVKMECPYLFVEMDTLMGSRVVDHHKICVMQMQIAYETYCMKKDQAEECLDATKSSIKQQSLGENDGTVCGTEQKVDLCRKLYSLIFQLVILFEDYMKLLDIFKSTGSSPQVVDMSIPVTTIKDELTQAYAELAMENGQVSPLNIDNKVVSKHEAIASIAEYLHGQQYLKALQLVRAFRTMWPSDVLGISSEDDINALLNIYCSSISDKRTGVFVLTYMNYDRSSLYSQLMDINLQLQSNFAPPSRADSVLKQADLNSSVL